MPILLLHAEVSEMVIGVIQSRPAFWLFNLCQWCGKYSPGARAWLNTYKCDLARGDKTHLQLAWKETNPNCPTKLSLTWDLMHHIRWQKKVDGVKRWSTWISVIQHTQLLTEITLKYKSSPPPLPLLERNRLEQVPELMAHPVCWP